MKAFARNAGLVLVAAASIALTGGSMLHAQASTDSRSLRALQHTVDSLSNTANHRELGRALRALAEHYDVAGDVDAAVDVYQRAVPVAALAIDSITLGALHNNLGLQHWTANRYDSALANLARSRDIRRALGDTVGLSRVLNSLGASYYQLGTYEPALDAFLQALEIRRSDIDQSSLSVVLSNVGKTYHDWNQYDRARPMLEQAVAVARREDEPLAAGYALNALAMLYIDKRDFAKAQEYIRSSIQTYLSADSVMTRADSASAWSLNAFAQGLLHVRTGNAEIALPLLDSVLRAGEKRGSVRGQSRALLYLGEAYGTLGYRARAIEALTKSLELSRSVSQRILTIAALSQLADLEESAGNTAGALRHLRAHQALRDTIFNQSTAQRIAAMEARSETEREQQENARLRAAQASQAAVIARGRLVVGLGSVILLSAAVLLATLVHYNRQGRAREALLARTNSDLARVNADLRNANSEVSALSGLIPICSHCKKVRDDDGYWEAVETFVSSRSAASFSHSICSSCGPEYYGEHWPTDMTIYSASGAQNEE